jgi:hypothetical protein
MLNTAPSVLNDLLRQGDTTSQAIYNDWMRRNYGPAGLGETKNTTDATLWRRVDQIPNPNPIASADTEMEIEGYHPSEVGGGGVTNVSDYRNRLRRYPEPSFIPTNPIGNPTFTLPNGAAGNPTLTPGSSPSPAPPVIIPAVPPTYPSDKPIPDYVPTLPNPPPPSIIPADTIPFPPTHTDTNYLIEPIPVPVAVNNNQPQINETPIFLAGMALAMSFIGLPFLL